MSDWEPWEKYRHLRVQQLDIAGPPCSGCVHWKPVPMFAENGEFSGVRLCHAADQERDFSCYRSKAELEEQNKMLRSRGYK